MSKRNIFIIIDAVRYDVTDGYLEDLNKLDYVIATGNRTPISLFTIFTGRDLNECDFKLKYRHGQHMDWVDREKKTNYSTFLDDFNNVKCILEIPAFKLNWNYYDIVMTEKMHLRKSLNLAFQHYKEHPDEYFIYLHLKAGHNPYLYTSSSKGKDGYLNEVDYTLKTLEKFLKKIEYDTVVICADHGEGIHHDEFQNHSMGFEEYLVHVPFWTNRDVKNTLYSTGIVSQIFREETPTPKSFVLSAFPSNRSSPPANPSDELLEKYENAAPGNFSIFTLINGELVGNQYKNLPAKSLHGE